MGDRVLEVGSMDVNGSVRENFRNCEYTGIDFREGPGVDVVMDAVDLPKKFGPVFDVVLCLETLEHCEDWRGVLQASWDVLKDGGKFMLTTPTKEKGRHNYPSDYWRWTLEQYEHMFSRQQTVRIEKLSKASIGALVVKSGFLCLDVEPLAVP